MIKKLNPKTILRIGLSKESAQWGYQLVRVPINCQCKLNSSKKMKDLCLGFLQNN